MALKAKGISLTVVLGELTGEETESAALQHYFSGLAGPGWNQRLCDTISADWRDRGGNSGSMTQFQRIGGTEVESAALRHYFNGLAGPGRK